MAYLDTYYSRTLAQNTNRPTLLERVTCDTCIIGGGLAGLTTALHLSRAGQKVVLLEAQRIGWGASGRNGGFVSPGFSCDHAGIASRAGAQNARALHALSIEGVRLVRDTISDLSITSASPVSGIMSVLRYDGADMLRAKMARERADHGYELEFMDRDAVREVLRSSRYCQALRDPNAFHMHPLNYLRAMAEEVERLGGQIFEASVATSTQLDAPSKIVSTAQGSVEAKNVLFATGGYTGGLAPALKRSFLPISTFVMLSKPAPDLIREAISTTDAVFDDRRAADYYRVVDGGERLLWGGRISVASPSIKSMIGQLRHQMTTTFPQLEPLDIETAWSGYMAYARHSMPQIGSLQPNVWYCTAFGGHGLDTTAIGGKVIAEAILAQSDRYKLFAPFGLTWTGGKAGLAVAQMTYWKLQLQDWWRERSVSA